VHNFYIRFPFHMCSLLESAQTVSVSGWKAKSVDWWSYWPFYGEIKHL